MANYSARKSTPQDEQELGREIQEQYLLAKRYLDPIHEKMNQQEELYRTYIDPGNYPHGARVFDPRTFRVIETVTPRMVANEPSGSFYPQESGDVATAQIFTSLIKYDWRRADMFEKQVRFIKSMLIFGTAFGRVYWDFQETEKTRMKPKTINGRTVWTLEETEKIKVTSFDGPNFEVLNIYDCFPDPNATTLQNMRWFIYRVFKTYDELMAENNARGAEYWKNLDKLKEMIEAKKDSDKNTNGKPTDTQYREHRRVMLSTQEFIGEDDSNPEMTVLIRYTKDGWCYMVPEYGNLIIREVENPYFHGELPIVYGVDYPYPGELYGMGEIEPIERIQRAINAVLNQRLDNVQLTLRSMWKVKKGSGVDMHTLLSAPGNIITTDDMNAVEPIDVPDVTGPTFVQTMNYLTSSLQNGSGITDYTIGLNTNQNTANETATGTRLIQQEANAQFKLKMELYNRMVVERIANQFKDLRIQYTTESQKLRILGSDDIDTLKENTNLAQIDIEGNPIMPGDLEAKSKLELSGDGSFAFLNLMPEDIQPGIVGEYDFIAQVSSDQVNDPIALQENFFAATDRITNPQFVQGLAQQGKMPNYQLIAEATYDKLQLGLESKDMITDMPAPPQIDPATGQPMNDSAPLGMDQIGAITGQAVMEPQLNQEAALGQIQNPMMGGLGNGQPA